MAAIDGDRMNPEVTPFPEDQGMVRSFEAGGVLPLPLSARDPSSRKCRCGDCSCGK